MLFWGLGFGACTVAGAMSRGTVRDARVEELFGIRVGITLANFYEDDTMWHERLVLWPSMEDRHLWYILTPDFDVYPELFNLDGNTGPNRVRVKGTTFSYWSRFSEPTYRFSDAVDDDAFKKYVQKAIEEVKKAGHWDDSKIPQMMLNLKGEELLVENMAVALSFDRFRSRNYKLLKQIRVFSSYLLARNIAAQSVGSHRN